MRTTATAIMLFILTIAAHKSLPEIREIQSPGLAVSYFKLVIAFTIPNALSRTERIKTIRKTK